MNVKFRLIIYKLTCGDKATLPSILDIITSDNFLIVIGGEFIWVNSMVSLFSRISLNLVDNLLQSLLQMLWVFYVCFIICEEKYSIVIQVHHFINVIEFLITSISIITLSILSLSFFELSPTAFFSNQLPNHTFFANERSTLTPCEFWFGTRSKHS